MNGLHEYANDPQFMGSFKHLMYRDFPGGSVVKNPPSKAGDMGLTLGQETKINPTRSGPHMLQLKRGPRAVIEDPLAATEILPAATNTRCSHK